MKIKRIGKLGLAAVFSICGVQAAFAQLKAKPITPKTTKAVKPAAVVAKAQPAATAPVSAPAASAVSDEKWYDSVKISGMIRVRPEIKDNFGFDADQKFNFVGQKVWLTAEKEFSDKSRAVITLQDVRLWGGQSPTIADTATEQQATDIREAYLHLKNFLWTPLDLKLGRQKLEYGEQMLVGSLDWANVGRSFDGAKLMLDTEKNSLHLFSTIIQGTRSNDLNNPITAPAIRQTTYFSGIYNQWKIHRAFMLDTFVFARNQDSDITANQLYTGGIRFSNRTDPGNKTPKDQLIDYSVEGAYQGGRRFGQEVQAYGALAFVGVNFNAGLRMRVGAQGSYASGDTDASDGKYETFDPLYPTPHYQFGQADMTSWRNLTGGGADYTIWFTPDFWIKLDYWYAMRTSTSDYWYAIGGAANTTTTIASLGGEKELYQEGGILINYKARDFLGFQAGYSYAMRGKALNAAGKSGDYQFAYLMSTLTF